MCAEDFPLLKSGISQCKNRHTPIEFLLIQPYYRVKQSQKYKEEEKEMKKMMFAVIIVLPLVLGGVLYGTHSLIIEEKQAITLEQAYMAQYPERMPDVMIDPEDQVPISGRWSCPSAAFRSRLPQACFQGPFGRQRRYLVDSILS